METCEDGVSVWSMLLFSENTLQTKKYIPGYCPVTYKTMMWWCDYTVMRIATFRIFFSLFDSFDEGPTFKFSKALVSSWNTKQWGNRWVFYWKQVVPCKSTDWKDQSEIGNVKLKVLCFCCKTQNLDPYHMEMCFPKKTKSECSLGTVKKFPLMNMFSGSDEYFREVRGLVYPSGCSCVLEIM